MIDKECQDLEMGSKKPSSNMISNDFTSCCLPPCAVPTPSESGQACGTQRTQWSVDVRLWKPGIKGCGFHLGG